MCRPGELKAVQRHLCNSRRRVRPIDITVTFLLIRQTHVTIISIVRTHSTAAPRYNEPLIRETSLLRINPLGIHTPIFGSRHPSQHLDYQQWHILDEYYDDSLNGNCHEQDECVGPASRIRGSQTDMLGEDEFVGGMRPHLLVERTLNLP